MNTRRFSLFALFVLCLCLAAQAEGLLPGEIASGKQIYTDVNGDSMTVPDQFRVSEEPDEQIIRTGAVIIGPDGSNYVMRGGGYNLMGGACRGGDYPAALRDPLPGNDHHPNVCFRIALFVR